MLWPTAPRLATSLRVAVGNHGRAVGAVASAAALHAVGRGFESLTAHQFTHPCLSRQSSWQSSPFQSGQSPIAPGYVPEQELVTGGRTRSGNAKRKLESAGEKEPWNGNPAANPAGGGTIARPSRRPAPGVPAPCAGLTSAKPTEESNAQTPRHIDNPHRRCSARLASIMGLASLSVKRAESATARTPAAARYSQRIASESR